MANIQWITEAAREFQKKFTSVALIMLKPLTVWITTNCGKTWETCMQDKKQQWEPNMEQQTFKTGKGVCQGCILSPCLFNLYASTSSKMPGWMIYKVKSRLPGELSTTSDMHDTTLMAESKEELKSLLMNERGEWKSWLKTQHLKNKDHDITPMGKKWKRWRFHFLWLQNICGRWLKSWN